MRTQRFQHPEPFPSPDQANSEGLLAIGGDLTPQRLLIAYRSGIFPWSEEGLPVLWWSPHPRAILELDALKVTRRLKRTCQSGRFELAVNRSFETVMRHCAQRPKQANWITSSMIAAYSELNRMGYAHSVEAWQDGELAGGIYGVAIGGFFAGESMFYRRSDASKVAFVYLVNRLQQRGFTLFDLQIINDHTARFGATEIARDRFLKRLKLAIELPVRFEE